MRVSNRWRQSSCLAAKLVVAALLAVSAAPLPKPAAAADCACTEEPRTITVSGTGQVKVKPDLVRTSLGLRVRSESVSEAMSQHRVLMAKVLQQLQDLGIEEKDVLTSDFSFSFRPPWKEDGQWTKGQYNVNNMVGVFIRDLDKVDAVLEKVIEAGANRIQGLDFTVEDTGKVEEEARKRAADHAREKAEELAKLHGSKLGNILSISEAGSGPVPLRAERGMILESAGSGITSPGERTISVNLRVVYEIDLGKRPRSEPSNR